MEVWEFALLLEKFGEVKCDKECILDFELHGSMTMCNALSEFNVGV